VAEKSGADILIEALVDLGVEVVFGYPGGAVLPIYDAIFKQKNIRHILVRHEQAATHAAEGYARSTGKPGVVLVTSGPGATNAVTGITDALMDSIPMVVITGQVPTHLIGSDAFQEADTVGITRHCTKHNYLVKDPAQLGAVVHEAFHIATSGRPGPVVIDIPKDVQIATARYTKPGPIQHKTYRPQVKADKALIEAAVEMLAAAERPIFYTGGGVINSGPGASQLLRELARITGAPVTSTLMGLGALPASSDQWLGMLGMHGTYEANYAMNQADLIIAVGARFDDRVTGRLDAFAPHSKKIHIDIDRSSMNKTVRVDLPIVADVGHALEDMLRIWKARQHPKPDLSEWWRRIEGWRAVKCLDFPEEGPGIDANTIMPQRAVRALWEATRDQAPIITTEVGQHQMWAAQHFHFESPNKWLTSRRSRHDGLWPARRDRRAIGQSQCAGDRHRRRSVDPDEHSGAGDRDPVSPAGQDLHPEQRIYGDGPPVAGTDLFQPLFRELQRLPARFCQAGRSLWLEGHPDRTPRPARRRDCRNAGL
jgi:acetolactate synthase-1/2/3 large subunit